MSKRLRTHWRRLENILQAEPRWLVAFSGGTDSALLIGVIRRVGGPDSILAVTAVSASLAAREKTAAQRFAKHLKVSHQFLETHELENPSYAANPSNRCFFCKDELYARLASLALSEKRVVADGFNASDRSDYRPGAQAAQRWGIRHPLAEADLTKKDIRVLSRWLRLPTWDKPASPCLASRLPYGTPVTKRALRQIENAERILQREGFREVRVRYFGATARIEVPLAKIRDLRDQKRWRILRKRFRAVGFRDVVVDPRGFRSGALNEVAPSARGVETRISPTEIS